MHAGFISSFLVLYSISIYISIPISITHSPITRYSHIPHSQRIHITQAKLALGSGTARDLADTAEAAKPTQRLWRRCGEVDGHALWAYQGNVYYEYQLDGLYDKGASSASTPTVAVIAGCNGDRSFDKKPHEASTAPCTPALAPLSAISAAPTHLATPAHLAMTDAIGEVAEQKGDTDVLDAATAPALASSAPPRVQDSTAMHDEQPQSSVADGGLQPQQAEENKDPKAEEKKESHAPTASRAGAYADLNAVYLAWERHCAQARVTLETW